MESSLIRRFCREGRGVGIDAAIHVVLMEKEGKWGHPEKRAGHSLQKGNVWSGPYL